jgi:NTE family protein
MASYLRREWQGSGLAMWGAPVQVLRKIFRSVRSLGRDLSGHQPVAATSCPAKIGVALGGGFARGIAHIGVLKVLEEEKIPITFMAGTSVGALIGAIYCSGASAAEMEDIACRIRFRDFARWTISRYGFASNRRMTGLLNSSLKVKTFEELRIPLAVTATDFASGAGLVFTTGDLVDTVRASCAYPGMFEPVKIDGKVLVDGMLAHPVPTRPLRDLGAEKVIGIHLRGRWDVGGVPRHLFDVIGQCFAIAQENSSALWRPWTDLLVEPEVKSFKYDDFEHSCDLIHAGEVAMRAALPEVHAWLNSPSTSPAPSLAPVISNAAAVPAD